MCREVALARIREDGDNPLSAESVAAGQAGGGVEGSARRDAGQEAFGGCQPAGGTQGVVVDDSDDFVDARGIIILGDEVRADALELVRSTVPLAEKRRGGWFNGDDMDGGIELL